MQNSFTYQTENIFKNPFDDINANNIEPEKILDWWCSPFSAITGTAFTEHDFATQRLPVVLQGYRGTGKTTILKYFSYPVMKERSKRVAKTISRVIKDEGSVGFYFRCDDSFINTFKSIFLSQSKTPWLSFFDHYLELQFCSQLFAVVMDVMSEIKDDHIEEKLVSDLNKNYFNAYNISPDSIVDMQQLIIDQIRYIDKFKTESIFKDISFSPKFLLELYSLSGVIIDSLKTNCATFSDTVFLILVDEFENMPEEIQRFFNTKIKFVQSPFSFRIGRRSEGASTTATINETEYLRENHDFKLIEIKDNEDNSSLREYFLKIANKRLASNKLLTNCSIIDLLGDKEDRDRECIEICKGHTEHLHAVLSESDALKKDVELRDEIVDIIKNPSNPIAETLNALWVIRSDEEPKQAAIIARDAMNDFFSKREGAENIKKYENDYNNKYRSTITILLAFLYKKKKQYYGFNAIVFLSDGNTRTFINICRSIISDAIFYEREEFFSSKKISTVSQTRAIFDFSKSEFESICSIIKYGSNIRNLILNIGNVFVEYHKDKRARYPETNQFSFDLLSLEPDDKKIMDVAISWSMIIKRGGTKRISAGVDRKGDVYYVNKAFAPMFGISYGFRGGVNPVFSSLEIKQMLYTSEAPKKLNKQSANKSEKLTKKQKAKSSDSEQISLFEEVSADDE